MKNNAVAKIEVDLNSYYGKLPKLTVKGERYRATVVHTHSSFKKRGSGGIYINVDTSVFYW